MAVLYFIEDSGEIITCGTALYRYASSVLLLHLQSRQRFAGGVAAKYVGRGETAWQPSLQSRCAHKVAHSQVVAVGIDA